MSTGWTAFFFSIALVCFAFGAFYRWATGPKDWWAILVAVGLGCWLVPTWWNALTEAL